MRKETPPTFRNKSPKAAAIRTVWKRRVPPKICSAIFDRHYLPPQVVLLCHKSPKPFTQQSLIKESQIPYSKSSKGKRLLDNVPSYQMKFKVTPKGTPKKIPLNRFQLARHRYR
uniref:Uncharacterized protein n=1 Tax=Opuntia streptacantha TaxID=393608 RepID=A0A7C9DXV4_OPUST